MSKTEPQEAYQFVKNVIESCESEFHFHAAGLLVDLFKTKYKDDKEFKGLLVDLLSDRIREKFPLPPTINMA